MTTKLRAIKSYVLRAGRMTPGQQEALRQLWLHYGVEFTGLPIDLTRLFPKAQPCVLEIGFGMGTSLAEQALKHPELNFLGIEVHQPGVGSLLAQLQKQGSDNVRVFCHDAVEVLTQSIADHSFTKIQVFFPDPWPKKRHHKRRLIQSEFVRLLIKKLKPQGIIHLATDWENYAEQMFDVLSAEPSLKQLHESIERPLTKFEQRGKRLGHGVWDFIFCHSEEHT